MQQRDLREAGEFARNYGVKALVYGPPGTGKTPVVNSAPRPVLLAVEPGLLSMRGSKVPTWEAPTWKKIVEFFEWFLKSTEARNFDTLAVDSTSMMCEIHLRDNPGKVAHGKQLYGKMAEDCGDYFHKLYYLQQKHIYLIAKQTIEQTDNSATRRPYFPGNALSVNVPHLYDEILDFGAHAVPGFGTTRCFQCHSSFDSLCRDRSGRLGQFEPADLSALFAKCMTQA